MCRRHASGDLQGCSSRRNTIKKILIIIIIAEIILIGLGNWMYVSSSESARRMHLVEAKRLGDELKNKDIKDQGEISFDRTLYPHIIKVKPLKNAETTNERYIVLEINGEYYRFEYKEDPSYDSLIYMNIGFFMMLIITLILFYIIYKKVMKPFAEMERLTVDLAKGHLSAPINEEKSRVFGKFIWGMDMLREQLEEGREREKAYQKERKTLMLSLSHDIKTPLSAIELYEKALSSGLYDTPEKQADAYAGIKKNAEELRRYIDEITAASREDFIALEVKDEEYYLSDVIGEINDYYTDKFASLHTKYTVEDHADPLLKGDKDRLVEVIQNLLENAIKYGDGQKVTISFSEEDGALLIHVTNTGESPKDDEMVHLFDSFYRGSNVGEKKGSGLGLYISKELMKRMDGDIYATAGDETFAGVVVVKKA